MVVVKWSDNVEGSVYNIYSPLCGRLYKEEDNSLVPWSGTYPDSKMSCFTWSKEDNDWIVPEDQYNEEFNNWRGPIHHFQLGSHTLKEKRNTEKTCSKYTGSDKFNGIPREGNPAIPINYYKDQCCEHITRNRMWDIFSLPNPRNK